MSSFAARVVNAVPKIGEKSYLELGVAWGENFSKVTARTKTGVELRKIFNLSPEFIHQRPYLDVSKAVIVSDTWWNVPGPATHNMTTDEFFASLQPEECFDVIFIDADHRYSSVAQDFQNSVRHLAPGGIILVHDLVPKNADHAHDGNASWNGTGFKMLAYMLTTGYQCAVLDCDFGLTAFRDPQPIEFPMSVQDITYEEFCKILFRTPRYTLQQLLEYVKR